ncbi:MAG: molybdate ABC transporter substrate-binding protein [Thermoleophilia bacterium]|nr:molybdate ABC transporter substrate-binding protein [Thermoleophilia bacterium]
MRRRLGWALVLAALAASGCAGENTGVSGGGRVTVFAAASLAEAFRALDPGARFNFAGSDELATQLREGAPADVYASASPRYADQLHHEGIVKEPRIFATNRLVLVVPSDNPAGIRSVGDLEADGVRLVVGAPGVPVGDYTRTALASLGLSRVLENVVSNEEDVKGVLGKVEAGDADAGFVYASDAKAAGDDVLAIELPTEASADIRYPIAVVADTDDREAAEAFVALVLGWKGRQALAGAGFGLP